MIMNKYKVLIVDDIPENIQTLGEMIKDFDLDVKIAEGGQEAIDIIDSYTPDIILLDLMMPHVNGWDVIDHVREKYSKNEMVIIVVSLLNNKDNIDECYELGVNDYITKTGDQSPTQQFNRISSQESQQKLRYSLLQDVVGMSHTVTCRRFYP